MRVKILNSNFQNFDTLYASRNIKKDKNVKYLLKRFLDKFSLDKFYLLVCTAAQIDTIFLDKSLVKKLIMPDFN